MSRVSPAAALRSPASALAVRSRDASRSGAKRRHSGLSRVGVGLAKYVSFSYPPRHGPGLIPGARHRPELTVVVLDGNGSILMNLGSLTPLARYRPPNLIHVVFDNEVLLSVDQSFTTATATGSNIAAMAAAAGVLHTVKVDTVEACREAFNTALQAQALTMLVTKIEPEGPAG